MILFHSLFYLMVLVKCDVISKSVANTEPFDGVSDEFDVLYTRQDVPDPVSRSSKRLPRLRKLKRPWLYMVPIDSYQSTAALENILDNIKYKNMKQLASSQFGSTGMVYVTQPGYDRELCGFSTVKPNILNKENKILNEIDADDTTTELHELIYIDNLSIKEGKNKRRTDHKEKVDSAKACKEKAKKKFQYKDYFKVLHPKGRKKEKQANKCVTRDKQDPLKEVPQLPKDNVKWNTKHEDKTETTLSTRVSSKSNALKKVQRNKSNKDKSQQNRHQRDVETRKWQNNHNWLSNFIKREPHSQALDSRVYEMLSNKLAYKDFVDGYKYYLNFEKDMAKTNFSDLVKYQAHKHHRVDDIGKFILEKLPPVPTGIGYGGNPSTDRLLLEYEINNETSDGPAQTEKSTYNMKQLNESADSDHGGNYEKYDFVQAKSLPSTPYSLHLFKKSLIDFRRPSWLGKSINSYSDSKRRSSRVRRHGIRFGTTQFSHSPKIHVQQKDTTRNVGFAKVHLVETAKTKKPYKGIFDKFKKHHSKRDTERASRSNFLNKLKQLFGNGQTASTKSRATEGYDFESSFYDIMKEHYPFYKASETNDIVDEKLKKPLAQSHTNRFSLDDYESGPKGLTSVLNDDPFKLTTPPVQDTELRKELRKLQQEQNAVSSKVIDGEYDFTSKPKSSTSDSFEPLNLKELEARENMTPQKEHKDITSKGNVKVSVKQKQSRPVSPRPTAPHRQKIYDRDLDIAVTSTEKIKGPLPHFSPSPMLDRFNQEFPNFTKEGKWADMEVLVRDWFDKHYPDLVKTNEQNNAKYPTVDLSDIGRLVKNWLEKHDLDWKTTKKAVTTENSNSYKKEKSGIKGKNTDKHDKAIDTGRYIKDWLDKFDSDCVKLRTGKEITNLKKENITTSDVGQAVKDWQDSFAKMTTKAINTNNDNKLKTVKQRMFRVKDWPELDNVDDKTSTPLTLSDANDFSTGILELDTYDYAKKIHPNDVKLTTKPETYIYLSESVPSYDPINPVYHENGPQVTKPGIYREHPKPVSLKEPDKGKSEINASQKTLKSKEKVKSRPRQFHIVKTFDVIYTAQGNMPSVNQSFYNYEAFFKNYSNLKKRNLRKSHMASTTLKTPTLSKFRRQKRFTENSEDIKNKVCPNVTPDLEMVDKRVRNIKRETNEKHVVKNVAALEVLMDMMKNNDEIQQTSVEKPTLKNHKNTNSVQVQLALPGNIKRSLKRVRKIFTARLFSPVDLEYQIHSYDDTLETTTLSVLPSGMYLLVNNNNSTSPRANFLLEPIPNDLKLSQVLQRKYEKFSANPDLENKKVEETTQNNKFCKVTLSKEFVSAVNEHLVQLYEAFARNDTKLDETTPHFKEVTLNSDFITVNIQRPEEFQHIGKSTKLKLHKRETKKAFPGKNAIKKSIWENKECNGKCQTAYEICPVSDEVMLELLSEMNSLVEYMNEHCTEIRTYFRNNPSGGRKLRDTVRKVNKLVNKYSKSASTVKSYYYKPFNKIIGKRHTGELIDVPQKYIPSNLVDYIENLTSYISNATKFKIRDNEKLYNGDKNLVGNVDKRVREENRNERSVTKNDKDVFLLDKVKVNIICKTDSTSTTPTTQPQQQLNQMTIQWFVDKGNDESLTKKQWTLKNLLWRSKHMNKKSKNLMRRSWKREVESINSPLITDTSGSFWSNYMHKFQKASHLETKRTYGETGVPMDNEKEILPTKQASATTYESTENPNLKYKFSKENSQITTSIGPQLVKETSKKSLQSTVMTSPTFGATSSTSEPSISVKTNTNKNLYGKKERKIKPKHKEKHTKMTDSSKPMINKDKSTVFIDNPVFNVDDDIHLASALPTRERVTNTNSNPTQSASTNSKKEKEHANEVKIINKSTFALKQLFKKIPGRYDKEKYKNTDAAIGQGIASTTANITSSTTASITPSLVRNVINQISKTGERTFKQWNSNNIVKYSGDGNSEEGKETNNLNLSNGIHEYHSPGKADGDLKSLLLSILQYETKRISNDTVFDEPDILNVEPGHKEESGK